jgi:hypothetical protein
MTDSGTFPPKDRRVHRFATIATAVFFAFILGFVPMWLTARSRGGERDTAQLALRRAGIENTLAAAAIYAARGEYEEARVAASAFYTDLQAEIGRADSGFGASREALQGILAGRDDMITLLARSDPAVAERLSTTYVAYREAAALDRAPS